MLGQDKPSYPVYAGLVMNKDFSFYIAIKYGKKMHVEKVVKKGPIKPQTEENGGIYFDQN